MVLQVAVYARGGDYPTATFTVINSRDKDKTLWDIARDDLVDDGSGKVELNINLTNCIEVPEQTWDSSARENDHSPCARENIILDGVCSVAREARTATTQRPFARVSSLSVGSAPLNRMPEEWKSPGTRRRLHQGDPSSDYRGGKNLGCRGDKSEANGTTMGMWELMPCWNYGQHGGGLWQSNAAVCAIFRRAVPGPGIAAQGRLMWDLVLLPEDTFHQRTATFRSVTLIAICLFLLWKLLKLLRILLLPREIENDSRGLRANSCGTTNHPRERSDSKNGHVREADIMIGAAHRAGGRTLQLDLARAPTSPGRLSRASVVGRGEWTPSTGTRRHQEKNGKETDLFQTMFVALLGSTCNTGVTQDFGVVMTQEHGTS